MKCVYICCSVFVSTLLASAQTVRATITTTTPPAAIAINPLTNKIYLANPASNSVSIADGPADHVGVTVQVGAAPRAIAVNTATGRIYVANSGDSTVSVVDGSKVIATVDVGGSPAAVAVNEVTNKIYVANNATSNVTVIDGASNQPTTFPVGAGPSAIAVRILEQTRSMSSIRSPVP